MTMYVNGAPVRKGCTIICKNGERYTLTSDPILDLFGSPISVTFIYWGTNLTRLVQWVCERNYSCWRLFDSGKPSTSDWDVVDVVDNTPQCGYGYTYVPECKCSFIGGQHNTDCAYVKHMVSQRKRNGNPLWE